MSLEPAGFQMAKKSILTSIVAGRVSGAIAEHADTSSHSLAFDKVSLNLSCPEVRHWSIGASNYKAY